ncbi:MULTISPECIES: ROK family protein [Aliiglaciecola]|uniref:ROK family protein n=1 Tax=Aliiglaciecola TaxID=1406885 RepID=UPI001C0A4B7E|nr:MULTISPECIES: ROK family protein [Aliiglaciecola]MBU2879216.1 ROK family protein [Aliiglaciecola lipolytica]MDO6710245.1 ROK family protein [Aliiglaciecola sp. 2_MG-2023]MDO6751393.1 ROK family protein [Aliiglaciecola sp. 1_MG-2023]
MNTYFAAIEGGGTKFNCAIIDKERKVLASRRIDTRTPEYTIGETITFFKQQQEAGYHFSQLGLASFGPIDLQPQSKTYGYITKTPKPSWSNTPIVGQLQSALNCNVVIDTDVNAAALAECKWGAAKHTSVSVYVTVGTGVGVGIVINGETLKGLVHPELGHMLIPAPEGIKGVCPFHGNCVEGLASGKAMSDIWGTPAETLADDHRAWDVQGQVLAKLAHNLTISYSPERIIFGGGVMAKPGLLDRVIKYTEESLSGYVVFPKEIDLQHIIQRPGLGEFSGLFGALALVIDKG